MKRIGTLLFVGFVCILVVAFTSFDRVARSEIRSSSDVFEGTSPCETSAKSFLKIPSSARCDFIKWKLVLNYQETNKPFDYRLSREYSYYVDNRTSHAMGVVSIEGRWEVVKGIPSLPGAIVYKLHSGEESISFIKVDENLIHLLEPDKTFSSAFSVQTFTLNKKGGRRPPSDAIIKASSPILSNEKQSEITYVGRTPCQEIAAEINIKPGEDCFKLKWLLTLKFDPKTHEPTVYELARTGHRQSLIKGKWNIIKGSPSDPDAIIYELAPDKSQGSILLLRADRNVLFFLDKQRNPLIGNADFSYTLNRKQ